MRTASRAAVVVGFALLTGCGQEGRTACPLVNCSQCPETAVVRVTDARTGTAIPGVTVSGGGGAWTCTQEPATTTCTVFHVAVSGALDAQVSAPGYATATVRLTQNPQPDGCCPACPVYAPADVQLTAI